MPFLNPWVLLGLGGIAIPVIIHLLNRHRVQTIDWAAMELLRKVVQVKSRQLRLQDIVLLLLRCLAIAMIVMAAARPTTQVPLGAHDQAVLIALDGSYSMGHRPGVESRMDRARDKVREILHTVGVGQPVTIVEMGDRPHVLARNASYDPGRFEELLGKVQPLAEGLNLERCLSEMSPLVSEMKAPQHEVYLVTDAQASTWRSLTDAARKELGALSTTARVLAVQTDNPGQENLAIIDFKLASGALRNGTIARYDAEIRNQGTIPRDVGQVELFMDDVQVDRQIVGRIAPGQTVSVPLYAPMNKEGIVRLAARIGDDELAIDNVRYATANIRRAVRVLVIDGDTADKAFGSPTDFLSAAISPQKATRADSSLEISAISWLELPNVQISEYDVIVLADVPDVPEERVAALCNFVESGGGLIFFVGDNVNPVVLNKRLMSNGVSLLPGELGPINIDTSLNSAGVQLDPALSDEALISPLRSLPTDLLTECRFNKWMKVTPSAKARVLLKLAVSGDPVLLEQAFGSGKVLLFTSTADRRWNNMAINPLYPILLQQAMTFMTRVPAERGLLVNEPIVLPLPADQAGASVNVTDPSGVSHAVTAGLREGGVLVQWDETSAPGFYKLEAGGESQNATVAVNIDPTESDVKTLTGAEFADALANTGAKAIHGNQGLAVVIQQGRVGTELWLIPAVLALLLMVVEGMVARWQTVRNTRRETQAAKREELLAT